MAGENAPKPTDPLAPTDLFVHRHIGPSDEEIGAMLSAVGCASLDDLTTQTVPASILMKRDLALGAPRGETETLRDLKRIATKNKVFRSFIGMGYTDTIVPPVILRNILENPGWYTQYTPYQAEISQGRLEALLNFQTMVSDLTGLPVAGASLLDEATAAAEAMAVCLSAAGGAEGNKRRFFVARDCHPQTIGVIQTRAEALGVRVEVGDPRAFDYDASDYCGALFQYPTTDGRVEDYWDEIERVHKAGALAVVAADILALTLLTPPGEFGADIAVGSTQRFGVPMGFGGPHAAYMAAKTELARRMPGRIIGVSRDAQGDAAYRMAIQTREQHIRRERATSNICTAQALLAIMAGMYAVYHGPDGLKHIGLRVRTLTLALGAGLRTLGHDIGDGQFFDTLRVRLGKGVKADAVHTAANGAMFNLRAYDDGSVGVTLDEATTEQDVERLLACFAPGSAVGGTSGGASVRDLLRGVSAAYDCVGRTSAFLTHPVFNTHHSETEMLRYIFQLQSRDLSLAHSMIPLGSCTMKLNATSEMLPVTWPEFGAIHPFAPADQTAGYREMFGLLERWLSEITGFDAVSLQPNAGSQGEYAGLLAIRAFHHSRGDTQRNVCLIPTSAHGTNPASAVVAGFRVVPVRCDDDGNVDIDDLRAKADAHKDTLGALMITYPSTHGVFEEGVRDVCKVVHERGGLVYMDGANLNAMVGLCRPADIGADVCHLNLHKTFCIPHGGGGPGMGPIGVTSRLAPFLPGHPVVSPFGAKSNGSMSVGPVSAAPWGSPSILTISWVYIALMGASGLKKATQVAILNANYMAKRLEGKFDVLFTGRNGRVAHEFIVDCRGFEKSADVKVDDIAKRLMDYGFHAPTMSWPVPGTLMIEPTESEPKAELDRLCDALLAIRAEIAEIEQGALDRANNPLKQAPHTVKILTADEWTRPYPRSRGGFPSGAPWLRERKFWPCVGRIDNAYGDRNLVCTCPPMDEYGA